jgi:two-component system cell cycle sensor histidine kinase/response regulator CckA
MPEPEQTRTDANDAALAASRLAAVLESSDDAIVSKLLDGTIVGWNPSAERIFGYSAAEILGSSVYRLIPPELRHEEQGILERVSRGEGIFRYETVRVRKDGSLVPIELTVSPVRDSTGVVIGASSIKRDVSERQRAVEVHGLLAAIVETTDDAILSKTLDGTVVSWNAAAERVYGYAAAEMIGQSIELVVPDELKDEEKQILNRVARGEHVAHYETLRRRKDGTEIQISLTISPIRDRSGAIVGASSIQRDITERKRNEAALRQASKMEAIGRLSASLAHDFNNQLHAVGGFANFAARDPNLGAAARQDLLQIQKAAERMASLTRQLLAFSRQQVLAPEILDLGTVISDTHPMLQRLIGADVEVHLIFGHGPKWVRVDRAQLVQVLMNLVINARDALSDGGRILVRTDTLEVSPGQLLDRGGLPIEPGAYAELVVQDTGSGIAPEHLPRIFEPFYTTKQIGRGTGLGLATVEGIVSQSGGHIQVESAVDQGTSIRILLPLTRAPEPSAPGTSPAQGARQHSGRRVLVVDDEELVRSVVARALQGEGYDVVKARDGKEAIDCLEQVGGSIDLVIADVVMPVMGGRELSEEIERRYPAIPLIWMSGHPREEALPPRSVSDQPFLQKPISSELLLQTVAQVLDRQSIA